MIDFILERLKELLAIDSPSGMNRAVIQYLTAQYRALGYEPVETRKGGLLIDLGGEGDPLMLSGHVDTLGAMVAEVKANGRLRVVPVGGLRVENTESENVRVYLRDGRVLDGTFQLSNPSTHVNLTYDTDKHTFEKMEVVLDERTSSREETLALGIENGEYVCFDPRTKITASGYIKSRFLDDKLSVAILLGYAKSLKDRGITMPRKVYQHFTVYEEVGHGGAGSIPADVTEFLAVDMGCVGDGLTCTEHEVSICAKDNSGPYSQVMTNKLIALAKAKGLGYAVDIYPRYSSDASAAMRAGNDARHGLIGSGVYASHGYERAHVDGVKNTLALLQAYVEG